MTTRKKIMAVVFDCDGVLFDSRQANRSFYDHIRSRFGLPPMPEEDVTYLDLKVEEGMKMIISMGISSPELADESKDLQELSKSD